MNEAEATKVRNFEQVLKSGSPVFRTTVTIQALLRGYVFLHEEPRRKEHGEPRRRRETR